MVVESEKHYKFTDLLYFVCLITGLISLLSYLRSIMIKSIKAYIRVEVLSPVTLSGTRYQVII